MNETYDKDYEKCPRCGIISLKSSSDPEILEVGTCSDCYYDQWEEFYGAGLHNPHRHNLGKYIRKPTLK